ncbi:hypothetical protein CHLNCDRAFT_25175, partial [Chlorella variabilis]
LVREFIQDSLYHPTEGYFSKQTATGAAVVGSLAAPLDFRRLAGQMQYLQAVQEQYRQLQASWLTPVEIFQPHYGRAVAACILHRWRQLAAAAPPPLLIYEIGGGTGTLARNILDWLREAHPEAYHTAQYRCIEISPVLAELQRQKVAAEGGHATRFAVRRHDAADAAAWAAADADERRQQQEGGQHQQEEDKHHHRHHHHHCFIIACEVLDNLPHDRVRRDMSSAQWQQTLVAQADLREALPAWRRHHPATGGDCFELLQAAADPLILRCLAAMEERSGGGSEGAGATGRGGSGLALAAARAWRRLVGEGTGEMRWLPTGCLQLLDTLHQARPSHTLIAADFDCLPEVSVAGANAPLVATTVGGTTVDHGSYLVPRGTADIFFPTDFPLLCMLYRQAAAVHRHTRTEAAGAGAPGGAAAHMCTADFMALYCPDPGATATRDGYNPLLQDYSNTAFFLGSSCSVDGGLVGSSSSSGTSSSSGESSGGSSSGTNGSSSAGGA